MLKRRAEKNREKRKKKVEQKMNQQKNEENFNCKKMKLKKSLFLFLFREMPKFHVSLDFEKKSEKANLS